MQLWFPLLAANAAALLLFIQVLLTKDKQRLRWIQKRAVLSAWAAFLGAALVVGFAAWSIHAAYNGSAPIDPARKAANPVSEGMHAILAALLLMFLPLTTRTVVNARLKRQP
jgi:hypothetical protein